MGTTEQSVAAEQQSVGKVPHVFTAVAEVMEAIGKTGIAKGRQNQQQGYAFRGIDDIYNDLSPLFVKAGLLVFPLVLERTQEERIAGSGKPIFFTTVKVRYTLRSAFDASWQVVETYGEGMDSADKSTNKAMSAALKYALIQVLLIPTEGDNDADAKTPEVKGKAAVATGRAAAVVVATKPAAVVGEQAGAKALIDAVAAFGDNAKRVEGLILKSYNIVELVDLPPSKIAEALTKVANFAKAQAASPKTKSAAAKSTAGAATGGAATGGGTAKAVTSADLPE